MGDGTAIRRKEGPLHSHMDDMVPNRVLPEYRRPDWVSEARLTVTDSHEAIISAIKRARQLGFEIARKDQSFFKRCFHGKLILKGEARNLDDQLQAMGESFDLTLTIFRLLSCPPRLKEVMKRPLLADQAYDNALGTLIQSQEY